MWGELAKKEGEEEWFTGGKKKEKEKKEEANKARFFSHRELKLPPGSQAAPLVARSPAYKVLLFHF